MTEYLLSYRDCRGPELLVPGDTPNRQIRDEICAITIEKEAHVVERPASRPEAIEQILRQRCASEFPGVTWGEMDAAVAASPISEEEPNFDCVEDTDEIVSKAVRFRRAQREELHNCSDELMVDLAEEERLVYTAFLGNCDEAALQEFAFFNRTESDAVFDHWLKLPYWTPEEAVSLLFGKEPTRVNLESLEEVDGFSSFVTNYHQRLEQVVRAIDAGLMQEQITPESLVRWAAQTGIEVPDELQELATYTHTDNKDGLSETERTSLLKMILGMAVSKYGYQGDASRNPATGRNKGSIPSDLEKRGIALDPDTIRRYLKEATDKFGNIT